MDHKRVIDELIQGKEFAKQLRIHLSNSTSSTYEVQELLIHNILNSYDKSLSLLTSHGVNLNGSNNESRSHFGKRARRMEPQAPSSQSPHSEFSDHDHQSKDPSHEIFSSKRKSSDESMQKLKNIKVKVSREMEFQEALDDGYGWTKYGQKDILGAKHPRGYYRCINRQTQGCLATKQVQRVDDATIIYDITYHGSHTCIPTSSTPQLEIQKQQPSQQKKVLQSPENISVFKAENLESPLYHLPSTSTFNLPTSVNTINRPTTSRSTYFTMSQPRAGLGQKDDDPVVLETELDHIVSTATSFKCSLNDDAGFTIGELAGFGNDINFDDPAFF